MKRRILITGGAGFIGGSLVRRLAADGGAEIVVLDDFSTGRRDNVDEARIAALVNEDVAGVRWLRDAAIVRGWRPRMPIEQGLALTVEYFRAHLGIGGAA